MGFGSEPPTGLRAGKDSEAAAESFQDGHPDRLAVPAMGSEKAGAGCWVMATTEGSDSSSHRGTDHGAQRSQDLPRITKQMVPQVGLGSRNLFSTSSGQHGAWKRSCPSRRPQHHHLPFPGRWPQNNFSLPELQCFISDSQLTRDAALHLRLGDRAPGPAAGRPAQAREARRGTSAPPAPAPQTTVTTPPECPVLSLASEPSGTEPQLSYYFT